jgi:hypothetical protein
VGHGHNSHVVPSVPADALVPDPEGAALHPDGGQAGLDESGLQPAIPLAAAAPAAFARALVVPWTDPGPARGEAVGWSRVKR